MNNTSKYFLALLCGIVFVALLYQIVSGWDTLQFLLRAVFSVALALIVWRSGILASRRHVLQATCWALAAVALFAGFSLAG